MLASVAIPTYKGAPFISYVLESLGNQSFKDFEVVIVIKPCGDKTEDIVRKTCDMLNLQYRILIQHEGYFTNALNMCLKNAKGDILLFTDDDAILPINWINEHISEHKRFPRAGAISGHIIYYDLDSGKFLRSDVERPLVRVYRRFLLPTLERPHSLFKDYRQGVYITNTFSVAAGPGIPYKKCLSLPVRGVNMSFKKEAAEDAQFPEHPLLKTAPWNEQYIGAQLVLNGYKSFFNPSLLVYHILRKSLSRPEKTFSRYLSSPKPSNEYVRADDLERKVMRTLFRDLLENIKYGTKVRRRIFL